MIKIPEYNKEGTKHSKIGIIMKKKTGRNE